jgi:hypothetical protein
MENEMRKLINDFKTFNERKLNEQNDYTRIRLSFNDVSDYNKSNSILYKNGFNKPTSPVKGNGYYSTDDNWNTIEFNKELKDEILSLLNDIEYKIEYKKPLDYKIFNQGGYLD